MMTSYRVHFKNVIFFKNFVDCLQVLEIHKISRDPIKHLTDLNQLISI